MRAVSPFHCRDRARRRQIATYSFETFPRQTGARISSTITSVSRLRGEVADELSTSRKRFCFGARARVCVAYGDAHRGPSTTKGRRREHLASVAATAFELPAASHAVGRSGYIWHVGLSEPNSHGAPRRIHEQTGV